MEKAQSQYLRLYDLTGTTYTRWQSYYSNVTVTFGGLQWLYMPFIADGFTSGITPAEANVSVTAPATSSVIVAFETAISKGWLAELNIYEFDPTINNNAPQDGQALLASYTGQVVGGQASLTTVTLQLGSALSPVGAQIPPRVFTTTLIGKGCKL